MPAPRNRLNLSIMLCTTKCRIVDRSVEVEHDRLWNSEANGRPRCREGEPTDKDSTENQIDRRWDGDRIGPRMNERSQEQVVSGTGRDQREYVVVCGLPTLRDKLSRAGTG